MPRHVQLVKDMEIDEVSLVDRAACPPAAVVIAKRAPEDGMDEEYQDENGQPLDLGDYQAGDLFAGDDGVTYELGEDGELHEVDLDDELADERELESVGKSAFFAEPQSEVIARVSEELSKAVSEQDRSAVLSKAFSDMAKRAEVAEARLADAETIAKSERDLRLTREYIAKAAEYNVPIAADELGPVLMRAAEALSYEDCAVIHKALSAAGEMLFDEIGYAGGADNDDPMSQLDALLDEQVAKSGTPVSKAATMTAFFDQNPGAYDALRAEQGR